MWRQSGEVHLVQQAECRDELEWTLRSVHTLTADSDTAAGLLLNRMNAVLDAAVDSNFGESCTGKLEVLYRSMGRLETDLHREDQPLFYFARSFAAVLDEAVRQRSCQATATVPRSAPLNVEPRQERREEVATVSRGSSPQRTEETKTTGPPSYTREAMLQLSEAATAPFSDAINLAVLAPVLRTPLCSEERANVSPPRWATTEKRRLGGGRDFIAPAPLPVVRDSRREESLRRQFPNKTLDFSPEAIEGRFTIFHLPHRMPATEVRALVQHFGRVVVFEVPDKCITERYGYTVLVKLESNAAADAAVAALHGIRFQAGEAALTVKRLEYLSTNRAPPVTPSPILKLMWTMDQSEDEEEIKDHVAAASAAAPQADVLDSDDELPEDEELDTNASSSYASVAETPPTNKTAIDSYEARDDRSDSSYFSVD